MASVEILVRSHVAWAKRAMKEAIKIGTKVLSPGFSDRLYSIRLAFLCLALLAGSARGAIPTADFEAANKLYEQGKFKEAAAAYERLLLSGQAGAAIYFNLGNAFFKAGQIGRAIAAYRQTEQLTPRDPDLRANLLFARNQLHGPTLTPSRWHQWLDRLTVNEWTVLTTGAIWLLLAALASLQWWPTWRRPLRGYLVALAIMACALCLCLALAWTGHRARMATVIAGEVVVHNGPFDESPTKFTVHDGAELRVSDQKGEWLEVAADGGRSGWLRRDQVLLTR